MSARGSAVITASRMSSIRASDGKCVTTDVPSSCTPCEPDSKSAAITPSRLESGVIRSEIQLTIGRALLRARITAAEDYRSRAQRLFQLRPQAFRPALGNLLNFGQSPNQRRLFVGVGVGGPHLQSHVQVSGRARVDPRQTPSAKIEHLTALSSTRYLQSHGATAHRHFNVRAERKLRIRHKHLSVKIFAVALEAWIFLHLEHDEDVPRRAASRY